MTNPFESIASRLDNIESLILDLKHGQPNQTSIQPQSQPIRLYGDRQAAQYLGCSVMTIQNLRRSGAIPFYRTGRKVYYIDRELDEALKVCTAPRKFNKR